MMLLALAAVSALALTWVAYRGTGRFGLMALRASALLLLVWLLSDPILSFDRVRTEKPEWWVLVDRSQSLEAQAARIDSLLGVFEAVDTSRTRLHIRYFDGGLAQDPAVVPFQATGTVTDIASALEAVRRETPATAGVVLVTDGVVTRGPEPIEWASSAGIPLFPVPVGQTRRPPDVRILDADWPATAFINTPLTVRVRLSADGFPTRDIPVTFRRQNRPAETRSIRLEPVTGFAVAEFTIMPDSLGVERWEFEVPVWTGDGNSRNNRISRSVRIREARTTIAHVAYGIHPDVGMVRRVLASEPDVELVVRTWNGNRFQESDTWPDSVRIWILHGVPAAGAPQPEAGLRVWRMALPAAGAVVAVRPAGAPTEPPYTDLPRMDWAAAPFLQAAPAALDGSADGLPGTDSEGRRALSLHRFRTEASGRQAETRAWGWYRWHTSPIDSERLFVESWIRATVAALGNDAAADRLLVDPLPDEWDERATTPVRARLPDAKGGWRTDVRMETVVTDSLGRVSRYPMDADAAGLYATTLPSFPAGPLAVAVVATDAAGTRIDAAEYRVRVGWSSIEFRDLTRRDDLLRGLAAVSGGRFDPPIDSLRQVWETADARIIPYRDDRWVLRHPAWFLVVIGLLTAEWIGRRRTHLP